MESTGTFQRTGNVLGKSAAAASFPCSPAGDNLLGHLHFPVPAGAPEAPGRAQGAQLGEQISPSLAIGTQQVNWHELQLSSE